MSVPTAAVATTRTHLQLADGSPRRRSALLANEHCVLRGVLRGALWGALLASMTLGGCKSEPGSTARTATETAPGVTVSEPYKTSEPAPEETIAVASAMLDGRMVIGPTAARTLGYRIDWEVDDLLLPGRELRRITPAGDALFVLDSRNELARVKTEDGIRIWQAPVGDPIDRVLGVNRILSPQDRVYVTVEGAMFVLDNANGGLIARDKLGRTANTASVEFGRYLIYGGRTGEIVWHEFRVGHPWKVNAVSGSIRHAPVISGGDVVAASSAGDVIVMDGASARTIWTKPLLAGVVASPAAGNGVVFVAGQDQYLWALSQSDGRTLWKYFTDAPLTTAPVLLGDRLYQRIPSEGLVCFDAFTKDRPQGKKIWVNKELKGEVIGRKEKFLIVWDAPGHRLSLVDDRGAVVKSVELEKVDELVLTAPENGDLFAASRGGRITRLTPQ